MGMMKREYTDHLIAVEGVEEGIAHLMKWGKKTFKDHTGEWVEVRCSAMLSLFGDEEVLIAHEVEEVL
jgi:hypothetical protein|tara:strand:- start:1648 stop:1851 length:204 start_codon:yes stop_codon:yes gene_type:complete